jgi:hypothetical protein
VAVPTTQYLSDFKTVDRVASSFTVGQANVSGTIYTRSVLLDPSGKNVSFAEYDLGRKYGRFQAAVGLRDNVKAKTTMKIEIFGDGNQLWSGTFKLGEMTPVDVSVTGVLRLRLQVTDITDPYDSDSAYAVFGDAKIKPA